MERKASPVHLRLLIFCLFAEFQALYGLNIFTANTEHQNTSNWLNFTFDPSSLDNLIWKQTSRVDFEVHSEIQDVMPVGQLCVVSEDQTVASLQSNDLIIGDSNDGKDEAKRNNSFIVEGVFIGRTRLNFYSRVEEVRGSESSALSNYTKLFGTTNYSIDNDRLNAQCGENGAGAWRQLPESYNVAVVRPDRIVDKIFIALVTLVVVVSNIGMGCKIDLAVVKEVLKKPIPPIIGFCCQFLIMPVVSIKHLLL